jgi:hypothetical protein
MTRVIGKIAELKAALGLTVLMAEQNSLAGHPHRHP